MEEPQSLWEARLCATPLNVSAHTVESYYARIQAKLGLNGMYELRRHAIEYLQTQSR